jgi:SAM-dependent methyltransferase
MWSVELIDRFCPLPDGRVIDIGGGISRLVDTLLDRGRRGLTVLDVSEEALSLTRQRVGDRARDVRWVHEDVLLADLGDPFDLWHDRAVFHFLTEGEDRDRYATKLHASLVQGGHAVMATFALDGPETCSGLPVVRYDATSLHDALGTHRFSLVHELHAVHVTPQGKEQKFQFAVFRRRR